MHKKPTLPKFFLMALLLPLIALQLSAQVCYPTFVNGCISWNNQSIAVSNLNWALGTTSCSLYDFTTDTVIMNAGSPYSMQVTNGSWCGCSVWADFNSNGAFDTTENLFHLYTANQTNYYSFPLTIPANIPSGTYLLRVIASWGSDGYGIGPNGYGGCGAYQYGNFDDFTLKVIGSSGIINASEQKSNLISVSPNPAGNYFKVRVNNVQSNNALLQLCDVTGKIITTINIHNAETIVDMNTYSKGIYLLKYSDGPDKQSVKVVK